MSAHGSILFAAAFLAPCLALADSHPYGGAVYNIERNERISYSCDLGSDREVSCDFNKVTISYQLERDKVAEARVEQLKGLGDPAEVEKFSTEACDVVTRIEADAAAGKSSEFDYTPEEDRTAVLEVFRRICEKRDTASIEALVDLTLDVQTRTCLVSNFRYTANFAKSDESTWVRTDKDAPNADGCGGVYLDRLESERDGLFWNLTTRSIPSNPNGTFTTGQKCSEIYTGEEIEYSWRSVDFPMQCDYIRIGTY